MADMLATPADIGEILELGDDLIEAKAQILAEAATAVVQEACDSPPQRLVLVEDGEHELAGVVGHWLQLPQRPARSITSVTLDGEALTEDDDFKRVGSRLWRADCWQAERWVPSIVQVVYNHGYEAEDQRLQLARSAVLSLVRGVYGNPEGAVAVRIDDYSASYARFSAAMDASDYLATALERQYGRRAALVGLG